jgi:hypothetical protein
MTVSPVQAQFIKPLAGLFKRTPGADDTGYFRQLKDKLSHFEPEDLTAAADGIAVTAETQTWPTLSICIKACEVAKAKRLAADRQKTNVPVSLEEFAKMPEEAAMRVLTAEAADLAGRACDEGWIVNLVQFVQERKRTPAGREIDELKAEKHRVDMKIEVHVARVSGSGEAPDKFLDLMISGIQNRRANVKAKMQASLQGS